MSVTGVCNVDHEPSRRGEEEMRKKGKGKGKVFAGRRPEYRVVVYKNVGSNNYCRG